MSISFGKRNKLRSNVLVFGKLYKLMLPLFGSVRRKILSKKYKDSVKL